MPYLFETEVDATNALPSGGWCVLPAYVPESLTNTGCTDGKTILEDEDWVIMCLEAGADA